MFVPNLVHLMNKERISRIQHVCPHHFRLALLTQKLRANHNAQRLLLFANDAFVVFDFFFHGPFTYPFYQYATTSSLVN